jgi:hypothetical protein
MHLTPPSADYRATQARYGQAIDAERQAWGAARKCLPGTDGFDPELWSQWQRCAARSTSARMALLDMVQVTGGAGGPPRMRERSANDAASA